MLKVFIRKINILLQTALGLLIRFWYSIVGFSGRYSLNKAPRDKKIIVSLTSYGRRTKVVLKYSLISLLNQRCKPDKIIVWLDNINWSDENLPKDLKKLKSIGVEFKYCEDLKSFKKLVPALTAYPDDILITVDDDLYYRKNLIRDLYKSYLLQPNKIHAAIAHKPLRNEQGEIIPYNSWRKNIQPTDNQEIFPTGGAGCLYPPHSLYQDVCNKDLFMKLCPTADDVWFWVMAKLKGTEHVLVNTKFYINLDFLYEYTHKNAALTHENVYRNANDTQIQQVFSYYKLK